MQIPGFKTFGEKTEPLSVYLRRWRESYGYFKTRKGSEPNKFWAA